MSSCSFLEGPLFRPPLRSSIHPWLYISYFLLLSFLPRATRLNPLASLQIPDLRSTTQPKHVYELTVASVPGSFLPLPTRMSPTASPPPPPSSESESQEHATLERGSSPDNSQDTSQDASQDHSILSQESLQHADSERHPRGKRKRTVYVEHLFPT